jgi:Holliday junction DNA helicase RuvA
MIAYLKGTVLEKGKEHVILLCGDVGYLVQLPTHLLATLEKGSEARLYTHHVIREDASDLIGFAAVQELDFFMKLITVSGVGPKMALHLMSLGPVGSLHAAVEKGDVAFLESAQGVGRKTAQRVVLELKGKLVTDDEPGQGSDEVVSALENLGYPRAKAREAAGAAADGTTQERIRAALKVLSK